MSKFNKQKKPVSRVVVTGGPCAGKTSVLKRSATELLKRNLTPIIVPEAATILLNKGFLPTEKDFQEKVLQLILSSEKKAYEIALAYQSEGKTPIILCDRGALDARAYMSENAFERIIKNAGHNIVSLRDEQYDAVFHLLTAANGKEDFYTLANNSARKETPEQARELDLKTQNAWIGHTHFRIIDNGHATFVGKQKNFFKELYHSLGLPEPSEIERKYLIDSKFTVNDFPKDVYKASVRIAQTYLISKHADLSERVRSRSQGRFGTYSFNQKKDSPDPIVRFEQESKILEIEYNAFLKNADPDYQTLHKNRTLFVNQNQYMEFDTLIKPHPGKKYLEVELSNKNQKVFLPNWLPIVDEVTGQKEHSMKHLARR